MERTNALKEDYRNYLHKDEKIKQREEEVIGLFNSKWGDIDTKGVYKLYGFTVNDKNKVTYVGV